MIFNILNKAYKGIWVPLFGRVLFRFVDLIEGQPPSEKPTFQIKDSISFDVDDQSKIK